MKEKVLVGLSGGVDSAIAAYLLKEQGYDVTCAFMRNWDSAANDDVNGNPTLEDPICPQESDFNDAKDVAEMLGLPLLRVDFIDDYWHDVFETFLDEYQKGRTPNPDILCNRYIKFDKFFDFAHQNGFETIATGHYAKIVEVDGVKRLAKADDRNKDQSYFLGEVKKDVFAHVLFPLGEIDKPMVRKIADDLKLSIAKKKDSTGICFIGERDFRQFLSNYLPMKPGKIIDIYKNEVVGEHKGVLYYTVGQRKGLDIGGIGPFFVVSKDVEKNELYVVDANHQDDLYSDCCVLEDVNWMKDPTSDMDCTAKFRYRQQDCDVHLSINDKNEVVLSYPQLVRSVTWGQEAVVYKDDVVVCAGKIKEIYRDNQEMHERIVSHLK